MEALKNIRENLRVMAFTGLQKVKTSRTLKLTKSWQPMNNNGTDRVKLCDNLGADCTIVKYETTVEGFFPLHKHEGRSETLTVLDGEVIISTPFGKHHLHTGDTVTIQAGVPHTGEYLKPSRVSLTYFPAFKNNVWEACFVGPRK